MLVLGLLSLFISISIGFWLLGWPWLKFKLTGDRPFWWPWLVLLNPLSRFLLTWRMRQSFTKLQLSSGLKPYWTADYWLANKLLSGFLFLLIFLLIAYYISVNNKLILISGLIGFVLGYLWPDAKLKQIARKRKIKMQAELPFMLDLLCLCVESGLSLAVALQKLIESCPPGPLRDSLANASALERTGLDRMSWLNYWANTTDIDAVRNLVISLAQADQTGMSLVPVLRAQAEQERSARFVRAETHALQAPVKMLFPMVICIFPCTFLIIGFPILIKLFEFNF